MATTTTTETATATNIMVTIAEDYMRDIFGTIEDAIKQRIFLEDLAVKYNAQLEELTKTKEELVATRAQLVAAKDANKLETIYAKIFLENLMSNKKMGREEVATVVEDVIATVVKKRKMRSDDTKAAEAAEAMKKGKK